VGGAKPNRAHHTASTFFLIPKHTASVVTERRLDRNYFISRKCKGKLAECVERCSLHRATLEGEDQW